MKNPMKPPIFFLEAIAVVVLFVAGLSAAPGGQTGEEKSATQKVAEPDTYPLDVCPISGGKLGGMGKAVVRTYEGREVRFCCPSCIKKFEADLKGNLKKLDEMIIAKQKPDYPLEVCLVSGEKLGEKGEPVDYVYDNQLVRFCCASCIDAFKEKPEEYLKRLREAYAAKKAEKAESEKAEPQEPSGREGHEGH